MFNSISIPYILLALLSYFVFFKGKDKKLFYANNFLIAMATLFFGLRASVGLFEIWYGAVIYELFAYESRFFGKFFYLKYGLTISAIILSLLNFRLSIRKNFKIQILLLVIFIGLAIINYSFGSFRNVTPGWHTTIGPKSFNPNFLPLFTLGIALNLLIINFKLIPELRTD